MALFADHGVAHVRDVAQQVLHVLDAAHGVLIPARSPDRLAWMRSLGVILAYAHDIGMADTGRHGRAMHAEYAVQAALGPEFDDIIARLRSHDAGGLTARLSPYPEAVLRELLAMAMCHSKSKVPVGLLNDPPRLRQVLLAAATTDLAFLHGLQQRKSSRPPVAPCDLPDSGSAATGGAGHRSRIATTRLATAYRDFLRDGFAWLEPSDGAGRDLVDDVLDTVRVLRCADALRQRGTALKTSGNNEIFVDQHSANAIFALRLGGERLYLLEISDPISAGEANLSSSELDRDGNLRIAFHHGMFRDGDTIAYAARSAALVVNDIYADTLGSFARPAHDADPDLSRRVASVEVLLESVDDNPAFAGLVRDTLRDLNAEAAGKVRIVPSLQAATPQERTRYLAGAPIEWSREHRQTLLERLAQVGHRTDGIDVVEAFRDVRQIRLAAGEVLVEAGVASGFVYIPEAHGLHGQPLGGYEPFTVNAWTPVGVTGVVRGATRNATIVARAPLTLIAIPKDVYLRLWHRTYDTAAFAALFPAAS
ncbi:hypothetical protein [Devosia sp.]|uniref:hypothetical protein n=1 Tax=Devosia sp. TaxID=1871048 RepID=UPI001ACBEC57|nr:hypothetical protein [Devosia sp.]MBN9307939.1 hypothetical protein [Devosia sp.]